MRHRLPALAVGAGVLIALAVSAIGIQLGSPRVDSLARSCRARSALLALEQSGIGAGVLTPFEALQRGGDVVVTAEALQRVAGVRTAIAPNALGWRHGQLALLTVIPQADASTSGGHATLTRVRDAAHRLPGQAHVGGPAAQNADVVDAVYGSFPLMLALIALLTSVLLARALRSVLLPIKAILVNLLSVAAAWGVITLVWQDGHASQLIWGIPATSSITVWLPLMVYAFLFGLSMDYEVFILTRVREEYDRTGDTNAAVIAGIGRTGRLITSAALILFLAFVSLGSGPEIDLKIAATGLGAGILLDATVVRSLLVPAIVSLLGPWNWWLPPGPARVLRTTPSPAVPAELTAGGDHD